MLMIMMFMLILTFLIMLMNHPLSAGLILLTQTILVALSTSTLLYHLGFRAGTASFLSAEPTFRRLL